MFVGFLDRDQQRNLLLGVSPSPWMELSQQDRRWCSKPEKARQPFTALFLLSSHPKAAWKAGEMQQFSCRAGMGLGSLVMLPG